MFKIATLNKISPKGLALLTEKYEITEDVNEAAGILVRSQDMHSMEFSSNLKAVARAGAGVNNIPLDKCAEAGIVVFNTPGANANAVKELVLGALFMGSRNLPAAMDWVEGLTEDISKAVEKGKSQFAGHEIQGQTLGVIGLGAIGVLVANAAETLGMNVIGYDPYMSIHSAHALSNHVELVDDMDKLLPKCDFITIHVPAMDATKNMINAGKIALMKDGACLLNFARDKIVEEGAVIAALEAGHLKHYITDFPNDKVKGKKGVIAIPHLGASTEESEENCARMAVKEIMDYLENGNITNSVNFPSCGMGPITKAVRVGILHKNVPGMVNMITSHLAEVGANIDNMINKSKGDYAYTLIELDNAVDHEAVKAAIFTEDVIAVNFFCK